MKKLDWPQVFACAVAGIVGGLIFTLVMAKSAVWAGIIGISAGEWLQAGAAVIGVFLTVQGTLWLEKQNRKRERKEEQRLMREALGMLKAVLPSASQPVDAEWDLSKRILMTQVHYEIVRVGMESLAYARQNYQVRSYNLWNSLSSIDLHHAIRRERLIREENIVRRNGISENVLAISREQIEEYASELIQPVNAAIKALSEERA
ncbi:hypothetical protein [Novosphingopyxis sp. YJ-S2-01]|uniref:hypothetical protein n=1 Tax=Novosphingopyxis sp. YJ-S2-01 TaxID=2794021 RepID=UPI0018DBE9D8|nr:hypothetical protein [Novosphingopyxis sp. YJ-S2-01]MBH9536941.1 hypothetical protein [Novosphingopyxis sp. YJ-S2-01]